MPRGTSVLLAVITVAAVTWAFAFVRSAAAQRVFFDDVFALHGEELDRAAVGRSFSGQGELTGYSIELARGAPVYGAGITGEITLHSEASLMRAVLIDADRREHLIYEVYSLLVNENEVVVRDACEETKLLAGVFPVSVRVELVNATATIESLSSLRSPPCEQSEITSRREEIRRAQLGKKIDLLNRQIERKGMDWTAGRTSLSAKSYSEKKRMFKRSDILPNLQGYEYYTGGVFELKSDRPQKPQEPSRMVEEFDWRKRHGATDPSSPYYDGDDLGTGWCTPIRDQGSCGSCWAHATVATAETTANLYYNDHVDLSLSEQFVMECSDAGWTPGSGCNGGDPSKGVQWVTANGVVDEECFPYEGSNSPTCDDACADPAEQLQYTDFETTHDELTVDEFKEFIIFSGPLAAEVESLMHDMNLVGFQTDDSDGKLIMIFKNSHGLDSGENGFMLAKIALNDFLSLSAYIPPAISLNLTEDDVRCLDEDKDGYCNWGIGPKVSHCPASCREEADCDDSNPELGPMLEDGSCEEIEPDTDTGGDADSDADGDSDGDSDSDSDGDSDGDSDSDSDSDADTDADTDADSDADGDTDGDADGQGGKDDAACGCTAVGATRTHLPGLVSLLLSA